MKHLPVSATAVAAFLSCALWTQAQSPYREAGYLYLSPRPESPYTSPETRFVLVRFANVNPSEVTNLTTSFITVNGASSGPHPGTTHVASDGRTVIFTMTENFSPTELVTVTLNPQLAPGANGQVDPFEYQFPVNEPMPGTVPTAARSSWYPPVPLSQLDTNQPGTDDAATMAKQAPRPTSGQPVNQAFIMPNGVSVPSDFPQIVITVNSNPCPGDLFLENGRNIHPGYTMIVDNNGMPLWYHRGWIQDLRTQLNGMLSWHTIVSGHPQYTTFDQNFNPSNTYVCVNGYTTDGHDFRMLKDGSYFIIGTRTHSINWGQYVPGGSPNATVTETAVQGFTPDGDLVFQWRAWDHLDIRISGLDFTHMNAVEVDTDGNLLVSSRYLWEVTKVNRDTGDIIWRLGGGNSSFTFVNDPLNGFAAQHFVSALGNNRYMVFDNGNSRPVLLSRAVEYQLDFTNMTATMLWQFRDTPDKYTYWMGSAQRLTNGNTLINFVRSYYPKAIEVDSNDVKHFELTLVPNSDSYRAYRFPWTGVVAAPYLVVEPEAHNVTLVFNKFGDHSVDHYCIYSGTSPGPTDLVATSKATLLRLTNVVNGAVNYFRVTAVNTNGVESPYSNEENLLVNIALPGQNMVLNGDFSQGTNGWTWQVTSPASANLDVADKIAHFQIANAGIYTSDIQLSQAGMHLTQGKQYTFAFDAWSPVPRLLEAKVEQNSDSGVNYSGVQPVSITPVTNHFRFTFTMSNLSDENARVSFNAGASPYDVYVDNVSLVEKVYAPGDFNWDGCVGYDDLEVLVGEWQKAQSGLTADLNGDGKVDFEDFVIFSQDWTGGGFCQ